MNINDLEKQFSEFLKTIPTNNAGHALTVVNKSTFSIQVYTNKEQEEDLIEVNSNE